MSDPPEDWNEWSECDITKSKTPDQILRENDGIQLELFPEDPEEHKRLIDRILKGL